MMRIALSVIFFAATSVCSGQWLERQVVIGDTLGGISLRGGVVENPISGNEYIEAARLRVFDPATVEKVTDPGTGGPVVFCPPSGKGYVIRDTLLILDAAADTIIDATALPFYPYRFAYSRTSNKLYLGSIDTSAVAVFDPEGDTVMGTIEVGHICYELLWDSLRNRVYNVGYSDTLSVIDCGADIVAAEVKLGISEIGLLALAEPSGKLYCAGFPESPDSDYVLVVSADSLVPVGAIAGLSLPDTMVYSPVTERLYCPNEESLYIVDCRTDSIRTQLEAPYVTALAVNTLDGRVYLGLEDSTQLAVLDTLDSIAGRIGTPDVPSQYTAALAFRPDRNELYGVTTASRVFVVDASADTVAGVLNYATYLPRQMVHNPAGNKLYLLCTAQDELVVVDSTLTVSERLPGLAVSTYAQPVLNPTLNRLYVADADEFRVIDCSRDSLLRVHGMYGISRARVVLVPYLNRLYVFSASTGTGGDSVYAYDCLRDTVSSVMLVSDDVPSAVYDPRSNRIFFCCADAPTLRALDPVTNIVVKTFDLVGGSYRGKMALNLDLGRLYYVDQSPDIIFTIDVLTDSVLAAESLPVQADSMFLNRRLQKLYLCGDDQTLVFDCAMGTVVDTISAGYSYSGLMDERNDKLYLRGGEVIDCRYDSIVTQLDSISPRCMAWDAIDNRVFQATTSRLYVYRDDPYGIAAEPVGARPHWHATIIRSVLFLPETAGAERSAVGAHLMDISGRRVLDLRPGRNDVRALPAGVYFVRQVVGNRTTKVVVER
jgi:DNA-binding beta-propeller fold protein YncE